MFKILETTFKGSVRFPVVPGVNLKPGHIVSLIDYQGYLAATICTDGLKPFGIVSNKFSSLLPFDVTKKVKIYPQRMIIYLTRFDKKNPIESDCLLYCSRYGLLTSEKPYENAYPVAEAIDIEDNGLLALWI